nr:MAG TPA: hypothetical protein [Caudoviricetes sp.]
MTLIVIEVLLPRMWLVRWRIAYLAAPSLVIIMKTMAILKSITVLLI